MTLKPKSTFSYTHNGNTYEVTRRNRKAGPQPDGTLILPQPYDLSIKGNRAVGIYPFINTHGPLTAPYLHELLKVEGFDVVPRTVVKRLTKLYNGYCKEPLKTHSNHQCSPISFLSRNGEYFRSNTPDNQCIPHDLTDHSIDKLSNVGVRVHLRTDRDWHRLHNSCAGASMRIAIAKAGFAFRTRDEIYDHPNCPEATRKSENPFQIPIDGGWLIPDDLYALDYGDRSRRLFIETDRGSESIKAGKKNTTYGEKLPKYIKVMASGIVHAHFGFSNFLVATFVPSHARMQTMIKELHSERVNGSRYANRFIFKVTPDFGEFIVPPVYADILQGWVTGDGKMLDLSKP